MIEEVKDEGRRGWLSKKSKSIGGSTAYEKVRQELEPKDLLKTKSGKEKRWFRKKSHAKEAKRGSNAPRALESLETIDLEPAEEKPVQRTVQGFYRDDDGGPSPAILQTAVLAARDAVKEFAKEFVSQLTATPDLCLAFEAQIRRELNAVPAAPAAMADLKFSAQAYIALHLFSGFENASFGIINPGEKPWEVEQHMATCFEQFQTFRNKTETISKLLRNKANDSFLSEFCTRKFKSLVPADVESVMFGAYCDHHSNFLDQKHPETAFYKSFLSAAVAVWLLQRLRLSFEQKVVTISPTRGDEFQRRFMVPAVPGIGDNEDEESDRGLEVLYTVFPGVRVGESIVKSLVYIVEKPISSSTNVETAPSVEEQTSSNVDRTAKAEVQTASNVENVATVDHDTSNVDNATAEAEIASTVTSAAVEEAPESAEKNPTYRKSDSLPVTSSTLKGGSEIRVEKFLSTSEMSSTKGSKRGLLQKIRHKIFHKKSSKKVKAIDISLTPAVSSSLQGEPTAHQGTPKATESAEGEPAALHTTPTSTTPAEGDLAAHQNTPAAATFAESEPVVQDLPAVAAVSSVEDEPAAHQDTPASAEIEIAAHQSTPTSAESEPVASATAVDTPAVAATSSAENEPARDIPAAPVTSFTESEPAQDNPAATAVSSAEGEPIAHENTPAGAPSIDIEPAAHQKALEATTSAEIEPAAQVTPATATSTESEPAAQDTPATATSTESEPAAQGTPAATATSSAEDEPAAHQSTTASEESEPAAQEIPAVASAIATSVKGEVSPLEVAPSSDPAPSPPPSNDREIEVSGVPSPRGPPLNALD